MGMGAKDAVYLMESKGLVVDIRGYGKVVRQSSPAGAPIFKGGVVELILKQ